MTDTPDHIQRELDSHTKFFGEAVEGIAQRLHDLADRIVREGKPRTRVDGKHVPDRFTHAAQNVAHEITWGVANLHADGLIPKAFLADDAARRLHESADDTKAEDR